MRLERAFLIRERTFRTASDNSGNPIEAFRCASGGTGTATGNRLTAPKRNRTKRAEYESLILTMEDDWQKQALPHEILGEGYGCVSEEYAGHMNTFRTLTAMMAISEENG